MTQFSLETVDRVARAISRALDCDPDVFIGMYGKRAWERIYHPAAIAALEDKNHERTDGE